MNAILAAQGLGFLYRTDKGRIGRETWCFGSLFIGIPLLAMTGLWLVIKDYAYPDSVIQPSVAATLLTYVYLLVYTFAIILGAICHYNLSAKRWRDRGRPSWLAAFLPLGAFLAAALTWYQPIAPDSVQTWEVLTLDAIFLVVAVWSIIELALLPSTTDSVRSDSP